MNRNNNLLSDDAASVMEIINSDKQLEEKLKKFKTHLLKLKNENYEENSLKDLLAIFFMLEPKHPVKSLIQTFFKQLTEKRSIAVNIFKDLLKNQIKKFNEDESSSDSGYKLVSQLNELSQNFEIASDAVGQSYSDILPFLNKLIKDYRMHLANELSPSRKNESSHCMHNCFQVYIFCVKSSLRQNDFKFELKMYMDELEQICKDFFQDRDISIETKNIFAMLIVTRNNFLQINDHMMNIADDKEDIQKRLCLMSGVIQIINYDCIDDLEYFTEILGEIYRNHSVDNTTVYTVSRLLTQITKKVLSLKDIADSKKISRIFETATSISLLNLEHNVESVRYMSKDTIKTLIEIGSRMPNGDLQTESILKEISALSIDLKASAINGIHQVLSIRRILKDIPDLLDNLLSTIDIHKECKTNCYFTLSNKGNGEMAFHEWYEEFIDRIIKIVSNANSCQEKNLLLYNILLRCIRKDKRAIQMILEERWKFNSKFNFMLLNLAKEEGLLEQASDETFWKGMVPFESLKNSLIDIDVDIRLSAISLIVDTKKATQEFTDKEIDCILYFLENNINLQLPSTKQTLVGIIKRIFVRIQANVQNVIKKNDSEKIKKQYETLLRFHKFGLENLKAQGNFSRRYLSLVLLTNIQLLIHQHFPQAVEHLWGRNDFSLIFKMLYDPYETVKDKALELMSFVPQKIINNSSNINFEDLEQLHKSIKPADSQTANYLILFCIKYSLLNFEYQSQKETASFHVILWCENQLTEGMKLAENSIIVAAGSNPLYPFLSSIRSIVGKLDISELGSCQHWKGFFDRLIPMTKVLTKIVAPIVNDASPEGLYPQENIQKLINDKNEQQVIKIVQNTTSQMILLCAWRIIKEVSLLLGDLSQKAAEICGTSTEIWTVNQLIDIGDHFLELLANIKHRGAFEQCFTGFSQYCIALRTSHCLELHNLPSKILGTIMDSISVNSNVSDDKNLKRMKNLCATRRSAGLPFIIQALLASEIKISKSENFHYTMKNLLNFAQFGDEIETKIHSLNILRVLYKCKELNDIINEYICEGLKCSILGCESQIWAVRNSSTLLFSSLMIRTFGVQRNKDSEQIDIKNMMSSKIFFLRYPELYEFFMDQLNLSACCVAEQKRNAKLFPLLLILNRLFTSPSETCESSIKLVNFIPIIALCSGCIDLKVRVLCAKFVASVNPVQLGFARIFENFNILRDSMELTSNFKHGRLLETYFIVKKVLSQQNESDNENLKEVLNQSFDLLKIFKKEVICFTTVLDIIIQIIQGSYNQKLYELITPEKLSKCFEFDQSAYLGVPAMQSQLSIMHLILMRIKGNDFFINSLETPKNFNQCLQMLNCAVLILSHDQKMTAEKYEIYENLLNLMKIFNDENLNELKKNLIDNQKFIQIIKNLTKHKDFMIQARSYEILSTTNQVLHENPADVNLLLKIAQTKPDDYKAAVIKYAQSWIRINLHHVDMIDWKILLELSQSSFYVNLSILDIISITGRNLINLTSKTTVCFSLALVNLLMDEDPDISEEASRIVSNIAGTEQVFIVPHAVELFVKLLTEKCPFKKIEMSSILIAILHWLDCCNNDDQDDDESDFQVFEKSESGNSQEWFIIREIFLKILRRELETCSADVDQIVKICNEIGFEISKNQVKRILDMLK